MSECALSIFFHLGGQQTRFLCFTRLLAADLSLLGGSTQGWDPPVGLGRVVSPMGLALGVLLFPACLPCISLCLLSPPWPPEPSPGALCVQDRLAVCSQLRL